MVVDGPRLISLFTLDRCDSAFLVTSEVPIQRQARNFSVLNVRKNLRYKISLFRGAVKFLKLTPLFFFCFFLMKRKYFMIGKIYKNVKLFCFVFGEDPGAQNLPSVKLFAKKKKFV